jgi:hypothetical protein
MNFKNILAEKITMLPHAPRNNFGTSVWPSEAETCNCGAMIFVSQRM